MAELTFDSLVAWISEHPVFAGVLVAAAGCTMRAFSAWAQSQRRRAYLKRLGDDTKAECDAMWSDEFLRPFGLAPLSASDEVSRCWRCTAGL